MLFGLLMLPSFLAVILAGLLALFCFSCQNIPMLQEYTIHAHLLRAGLYFSLAAGLPLAVFSAISGAVLMVAGFIFKSWIRAIMAILIGLCGMYMWHYFLNLTL